ncbi:hypothetical protein KJ766_03640 [Patescibacteria group bacterium]|nr:hypothetical protein [Patescibacteria group bacterium]
MTVLEKTNKQQPKNTNALELVGRMFSLYKTHFNVYFGYAAWLFVPVALTVLAFITLNSSNFELVNIILSLFVTLLLGTWIQIICIQLTQKIDKKKTIHFKKISSEAWKLMVPYLLISIVTGVMILLGFVFLIIPGIIASVLLVFATTIVALEYKPIWQAIRQSYKLASKNFFSILLKLVVGYFSILAIYLLGYLMIYAFGWFLSGVDFMSYFQSSPTLVEDLLTKSLSIVLLPLFPIFHTLLYLDSKN